MKFLLRLCCLFLVVIFFAAACKEYRSSKGANSVQLVNIKRGVKNGVDRRVYKTIDNTKLELHIFFPDGYDSGHEKPYPAILCFHGGGWTEGTVKWGYVDAEFFASIGFVAAAVEYRVADREKVSVLDSMKDAASSIRWMRLYADELNVDPSKVAAMGGSAGGHLALCTATFPDIIDKNEDSAVSSEPDMVFALAAPVSVMYENYFQNLLLGQRLAKKCSPLENIQFGMVPVYMVNTVTDELVSYHITKRYVERMNEAGNTIKLFTYPNGAHSFFYETGGEGVAFWQDAFLDVVKKSGWID